MYMSTTDDKNRLSRPQLLRSRIESADDLGGAPHHAPTPQEVDRFC